MFRFHGAVRNHDITWRWEGGQDWMLAATCAPKSTALHKGERRSMVGMYTWWIRCSMGESCVHRLARNTVDAGNELHCRCSLVHVWTCSSCSWKQQLHMNSTSMSDSHAIHGTHVRLDGPGSPSSCDGWFPSLASVAGKDKLARVPRARASPRTLRRLPRVVEGWRGGCPAPPTSSGRPTPWCGLATRLCLAHPGHEETT